MGAPTPSRKKIRLDISLYLDPTLICSITICTQNKQPVFHNLELGQACIHILEKTSYNNGTSVFAFCFMPDHVHILMSPSSLCPIPSFVGRFKSLCANVGRTLFGLEKSFWQKRYYDHFLRKEESLEQVVQYILNNPVRKGLVNNWKDYPLSGSFVFEL